MKRAVLLMPLLFAVGLLAACDLSSPKCGGSAFADALSCEPVPTEGKLGAEVVEFVGDSPDGLFPAARDAAPIDVALLRGWAKTGSSDVRDPATAFGYERDTPDLDFVAVSATTGCRLAESAELYLRGGDLHVEFTGGQDREECVRPLTAYVQFAVPAAEIADALTIEGEAPVDAAGPGKLSHFVPLGVLSPDAADIDPTRLGEGRGEALLDQLVAAGATPDDELREAVTATGVAFVLSGCAEDGAKLVVTPTVASAELTGGERTDCEAASWFLATFTVDDEYLPAGSELMIYGR